MCEPDSKITTDVPTQIFEQFCAELDSNGTPSEVTARLRKTLLKDGKFTEVAIKAAIFSDSEQQQ